MIIEGLFYGMITIVAHTQDIFTNPNSKSTVVINIKADKSKKLLIKEKDHDTNRRYKADERTTRPNFKSFDNLRKK